MYLSGGTRRLSTHIVVYNNGKEKGIECYFAADFSSGWPQVDVDDVESCMSRTGYVLIYTGCQILCCSQLRTEITTEADYTT